MGRASRVALTVLTTLLGCFGCRDEGPEPRGKSAAAQPPAVERASSPVERAGTVVETMNAGPYTYVCVERGGEKIWMAGPATPIKVGERVSVPADMTPMKNWHSKTLNRTFDMLYLAGAIRRVDADGEAIQMPSARPDPVGHKAASDPEVSVDAPGRKGKMHQMPPRHPGLNGHQTASGPAASVDFSGIKKIEGGKTVAEVYAEKKELAGKEVVLRGKIVKVNPGIMGKNWLHLQDGTGSGKTSDLTVTTNALPKVWDTVVVTGQVSLDKDVGFGRKYDIIIENATVAVE